MNRKRLRFLVAIDFSPESARALRTARALASRAGGVLTLLHVRPQSDVRAAVVENQGELLRGKPGTLHDAIARHYAERFARFAGSRGRAESLRLRRGKPSIELRREARGGYDLLVMGSRGRGKVAGAILGSTVQEILSGSPVPVLVVGR